MVATKRRFNPNLQKVRIFEAGAPTRVYVCTRCLKAGKVTKAASADRAALVADPSLVRFRAVVAACARAARGAPPGDQRPQRLPGRRRRHRATTWRSRCAPCSTSSTAWPPEGRRSTRSAATRSSSRVARAALLGARGNSGVILSQLIRGAAEELASRPGELVDPVLIGAAMARAADRAYGSVREPAEGTILTVVREMAHRVAFELAAHGPSRGSARSERRPPGRADRRGARARARRRRGVRPARPRPAAGAARGGRRRRRRLRRSP